MIIPNVGTYVIRAENDKVSWSEGKVEEPTL